MAEEALCTPEERVNKEAKLVIVGPGEGHQHTATVLVLHGFGDTAAGVDLQHLIPFAHPQASRLVQRRVALGT